MRCQRRAPLPQLLRVTLPLLGALLLGCGTPGERRPEGAREKRVLGADHAPGPDPDAPENRPQPIEPRRDHFVPAPVTPRIDEPEDRPPEMNEGGSPLDLPRSDGAPRTVMATLDLDAKDRPERAALVLLGFRAVDITAKGALKPGRRPQWYWASPVQAITGPQVTVQAPLPEGLAMFALLDLNGDLAPGQGEYMSAIQREFVLPPEDGVALFALDRRFGAD